MYQSNKYFCLALGLAARHVARRLHPHSEAGPRTDEALVETLAVGCQSHLPSLPSPNLHLTVHSRTWYVSGGQRALAHHRAHLPRWVTPVSLLLARVFAAANGEAACAARVRAGRSRRSLRILHRPPQPHPPFRFLSAAPQPAPRQRGPSLTAGPTWARRSSRPTSARTAACGSTRATASSTCVRIKRASSSSTARASRSFCSA